MKLIFIVHLGLVLVNLFSWVILWSVKMRWVLWYGVMLVFLKYVIKKIQITINWTVVKWLLVFLPDLFCFCFFGLLEWVQYLTGIKQTCCSHSVPGLRKYYIATDIWVSSCDTAEKAVSRTKLKDGCIQVKQCTVTVKALSVKYMHLMNVLGR